MSAATLSDAAADVLRRSTATEKAVTLPNGQLDRAVYVEVNKALERIGGKWNRSAKAHVFAVDPRPALDALAGSGLMPVDQDKEMAFFRTPPEIAAEAVDALFEVFSGESPDVTILEPSAGDGALADAVHDRFPLASLSVVEPDSMRYAALWSKGYGVDPHSAYEGTFEDYVEDVHRDEPFDGVIMNPPFSLAGHPVAWAEHVALAWGLLKPGGRLVAIIPNALSRQHKLVTPIALLVAQFGWTKEFPDGAFKVSGTGIKTSLIVLDKPAGGL